MKARLKDLYKELWLRDRNSGELVWEGKDGSVPIREMSDEYLNNAIRAMEQQEHMLDCWADYEASHNN